MAFTNIETSSVEITGMFFGISKVVAEVTEAVRDDNEEAEAENKAEVEDEDCCGERAGAWDCDRVG